MVRLVALAAILSPLSPALAQTGAQPTPNITPSELGLLLETAAFSSCDLASQKVSWETAVGSTSKSIALLIIQRYGGRIPGDKVQKKPEEIGLLAQNEVAFRSYRMCQNLVPDKIRAEIKTILEKNGAGTK